MGAHELSIRALRPRSFGTLLTVDPSSGYRWSMGLALLAQLAAERSGELRKLEREAGVEQAPRQHPLPGEQRLLAHLAQHQLHRELGHRRDRRPVEHLSQRVRELFVRDGI